MAISALRSDGPQPPSAPSAMMLPVQRPAASGLSQSFHNQIRAQVQSLVTGAATAGSVHESPDTTARASALQQSLITGGSPQAFTTASGALPAGALKLTSTGQWAGLARGIGGEYLSQQAADVFVRQMALESGNFNPDVISGRRVSPAGAEGIAQLMPSSYPNVNRLDPVASLNAAAGTMRDNLQQYGGDIRKALAAYNAGGGTVSGLVRSLGANWESGLPAETRQYLQQLAGQ